MKIYRSKFIIRSQTTHLFLVLSQRYSKGNKKIFILALNDKLVKLNNITHKFYIIGNFNIDVNSSDISNNSAPFFNMLNSNGVYSLIDKPTHVTGTSSTNIDHILTDDTSNIIYPCIFLSEISDYFPVGFLVPIIKLFQTVIIKNLKLQNTCTET